MDETTLALGPPMRACWMKVGQQKRIPAPLAFSKQRHHLIDAYNWSSDTAAWRDVPWKNSEFFIAFLEYLLVTVYPGRRVALVMEDVAYHRSAATLAALCLFEHRVRVVWLPACCPDLNFAPLSLRANGPAAQLA